MSQYQMTTPDGESLMEWKEKYSPNEEITSVATHGFEIIGVQIKEKVFLLRTCEYMIFSSPSDAKETMNRFFEQETSSRCFR